MWNHSTEQKRLSTRFKERSEDANWPVCRRQTDNMVGVVWMDKKPVNVVASNESLIEVDTTNRRQKDGNARVTYKAVVTNYQENFRGVDILINYVQNIQWNFARLRTPAPPMRPRATHTHLKLGRKRSTCKLAQKQERRSKTTQMGCENVINIYVQLNVTTHSMFSMLILGSELSRKNNESE
ncbi:unnamed protein product [Mytilus edulis]|uniref:Uncharacterized protein n=1 Tax=Mytilus edulis TaxID=6550 RepID=A0A8S3PW17_MYTED|nr:unnamed protein product [Mytilus edulis]